MSGSKAAVVTAAGHGMGKAIAERLHQEGYKLALMSNGGGALEVARALDGVAITGSVTSPDDLKRLVELAMAEYGRVDAVVNNTGHPPKGALLEISDEAWYAGTDMVLLNVIRMTRLITPIFLAQGGGSIVNISTYAAFEPEASFPVSCTLRAALASYTKLYADQYAAHGIRMNNVLPGFIDSYPESDDTLARIPMGRYGTVGEIAETTHFLLSEAGSYITGQNLRVDGGLTRSV